MLLSRLPGADRLWWKIAMPVKRLTNGPWSMSRSRAALRTATGYSDAASAGGVRYVILGAEGGVVPVALIRHGPTVWNEQKRLQGRADIPLSPDGLAAVRRWRVPEAFAGFEWLASPLSRAAQTAALLDLDAAAEPAIVEMHWGDWDGHTHAELQQKYGDGFRGRAGAGLDLRPPGGESLREVRRRAQGWLAEVAARGRPTGAVTHQVVIRAVLSLATGWTMEGAPPHALDWASMHLFTVAADGTVSIDRLNISLTTACPI